MLTDTALRHNDDNLGRLSAMLAHEINNPCGIALSNVSLALSLLERLQATASPTDGITLTPIHCERLLAGLADCRDGLQRIEAIVTQFTLFGRASQQTFGPVACEPLLASAWQWVCRAYGVLPRPVCFTVNMVTPQAGPFTLLGQETLLSQALTNVFRNALEALMETEPVEPFVQVNVEQQGTYLHLTISDNGGGMPPHVVARAGEAFYSTKPLGQGAGLGLSMVQHIVSLHQGHWHLSSQQGQGSAVTLVLPLLPVVAPLCV
jgi:two-component system, NtrC family, sensor kinase